MSVPPGMYIIGVYIIVVLVMLIAHAMTFYMMKRKIETLQAALVAKRVLMPSDNRPPPRPVTSHHLLLPGETLSIRAIRGDRVDITSRCTSSVDVSYAA